MPPQVHMRQMCATVHRSSFAIPKNAFQAIGFDGKLNSNVSSTAYWAHTETKRAQKSNNKIFKLEFSKWRWKFGRKCFSIHSQRRWFRLRIYYTRWIIRRLVFPSNAWIIQSCDPAMRCGCVYVLQRANVHVRNDKIAMRPKCIFHAA